MSKYINSFNKLREYCENENYKGWDPYDGLNSKVYRAIPFMKDVAFLRLCVIQGFKRCPVNLRRLLLVPKEYNAKGIGLFLQGYCNLYKAVEKQPNLSSELGSCKDLQQYINDVAELLISMQSKGDYHGACWGYNFDWQAMTIFLFPKFTPTVVATTFCATALMDAYEITKNKKFLDVALTSAEFILHDLHRSPYKSGFLFSYSPYEGNDTVFNASLLGSALLSRCYHYTGNKEYLEIAEESVKACCDGQRNDGAWRYGLLPGQVWVDGFHTGYNLDALKVYEENTGDMKYHKFIEKGFNYYINNLFHENGLPKYYDNKTYPIDIHCPGQLVITLSRLGLMNEYKDFVGKVMNWTIDNMQDKKGYFYYQLKKGWSSKISYMRWSNAYMFNAMAWGILNGMKF